MNCQDVTGILDNQRLDRLDSARRRLVEEHVALCAECARAWYAQTSLAALPDMTPSADFSSRCRALVAGNSVRVTRRRAGNRVLLWSAITAIAAAAAVLALQQRPTASTSSRSEAQIAAAEHAAISSGEAALPAGDAESTELGTGPAAAGAIEAAATPLFTVRVVFPEAPANPSQEFPGQPLLASDGPALEQVLGSLRAALIQELRRVPGVALVDSDPAEVTPSSRHYRLRVSSMIALGPDGRIVHKGSRYFDAGFWVEQSQADGKSINRLTIVSTIDLLAPCSGAPPVVDTPCTDVQGTAAAMVRRLRQEVFPPDSVVTRALQSKFRSSSLGPAQRLKVLAELFNLQVSTGDQGMLRDHGVVRAAIEVASYVEPAQRAQVWRSMRGTGDADLIEPLMTSLLQDPEEVRLAAVETLAADFNSDPRVRSALEVAAVSDARPLVRAVAERSLSGDLRWRQYVVASLKNSSLSASRRIEALMYELYPPGPEQGSALLNPDYSSTMGDLLDDSAVRALAEVLPEAGKRYGNLEGNLIHNLAGAYRMNPAVTDMLLDYLLHDATLANRRIAAQSLARMHVSEPRVRDALKKAANTDPDMSVRDWIRQVMPEMPQ